jgi:mycothiol synthase
VTLPVTYDLRAATAADLPAIHALVRRFEIADGIQLVTPLEELEEWLEDPHLSLADDTRVACDAAGAIAAYGRLWHRPSDSLESRVFLLGAVDPDHRRRGLGHAIFRWQLARGREILLAQPDHLPRFLRTQAYDFERGAIALYEAHGMRPVRTYEELLRPLADEVHVEAPPGIAIAPWDPARSEELRLLHNEAFADQWGTTPLDPAAWRHRLEAAGNRHDLSFIALDGDRVVGICMNGHFPGDQAVTGRLDGWIRNLGTARSHRRRGIASALLLASCAAFRAAGFTHATLGVDSDSQTGAHRLYRRLGFTLLNRSFQHQLTV